MKMCSHSFLMFLVLVLVCVLAFQCVPVCVCEQERIRLCLCLRTILHLQFVPTVFQDLINLFTVPWYNKEVRTQYKNCVTTNVVIPVKTVTSTTN